ERRLANEIVCAKQRYRSCLLSGRSSLRVGDSGSSTGTEGGEEVLLPDVRTGGERHAGQLSKMRNGARAQSSFSRAEEDYLHLPDASADSAGSPGKLPNLRHDTGAEDD